MDELFNKQLKCSIILSYLCPRTPDEASCVKGVRFVLGSVHVDILNFFLKSLRCVWVRTAKTNFVKTISIEEAAIRNFVSKFCQIKIF